MGLNKRRNIEKHDSVVSPLLKVSKYLGTKVNLGENGKN
jgi:hypothetical protein